MIIKNVYRVQVEAGYINGNYSTIYDARINSISKLTEGETYWMQMDGSAGGSVGSCMITIKELSTSSVKNVSANNDIKLYPNPNNGSFTIDLYQFQKTHDYISIEVIDNKGVVLKNIKLDKGQKICNLTVSKKGLFFVRIRSLENTVSIPVLIN